VNVTSQLSRFLPASQDAGNRIGLVYNFISVLLNYVAHYNMSTFKCKSMSPTLRTPIWDPNLGPRFGTPFWDPDLGPRFGTPIWNPDLGPRFGTPIWVPDLGP
jgi:hypothetical protein